MFFLLCMLMTGENMENNTYKNNLENIHDIADDTVTSDNEQSFLDISNPETDNSYSDEMMSAELETQPVSADDDLNWNIPENDIKDEADDSNLTRLAIDWAELEGALENNSPDLHSFLNKYTGDVIRIFNNGTITERRLQDVEADPAYLYVEPISSREQYKWMEEFIEEIDDGPLKDKLLIAVDGKGAFRRFKDVLADDQDYREKWYSKRSSKLSIHINEWLKTKNIKASNPAPWEEGYTPRKVETVKKNRYVSSYTQSFGSSLRRMSHEMIDLIPSRDLSIAVAFLEFLSKEYKHHDDRD